MELMTAKGPISPFEIGAGSSTVGPLGQIGAGSSTVNGRDPRIAIIERKRVSAGWSHVDLCRRANIRKDTWAEIRAGRRAPIARTLDRLEAAFLDAPAKKPPQIIKSFHRCVVTDLCKHLRAPLDRVTAQDLTVQRPRNPEWLRAARINRMAIYIIAVELELENAELARALGCTRQNVKQARDDVFDWMDADRAVAKAIAAVSAQLTGRIG